MSRGRAVPRGAAPFALSDKTLTGRIGRSEAFQQLRLQLVVYFALLLALRLVLRLALRLASPAAGGDAKPLVACDWDDVASLTSICRCRAFPNRRNRREARGPTRRRQPRRGSADLRLLGGPPDRAAGHSLDNETDQPTAAFRGSRQGEGPASDLRSSLWPAPRPSGSRSLRPVDQPLRGSSCSINSSQVPLARW